MKLHRSSWVQSASSPLATLVCFAAAIASPPQTQAPTIEIDLSINFISPDRIFLQLMGMAQLLCVALAPLPNAEINIGTLSRANFLSSLLRKIHRSRWSVASTGREI